MNSKRKNYTMVLNTSLLCFALASGQAVFAQNNVNTSQKGAVQARVLQLLPKVSSPMTARIPCQV